MTLCKPSRLKLTPDQQSLVDNSIRMDQWAMDKSQPSQPLNDLQRHLIASSGTQRQAKTALLTNVDCMANHKISLCHVLATAHKLAFMPKVKRNLLNLNPIPMVFGELNPNYQGLLFPDTSLRK